MRLNKFLAHSGISSRRKCDQLIESGKVKINGHIERNFACQVESKDVVVCDGVLVDLMPKHRVYLVNKLKGYISTSSDPKGRKKVIDLVKSTDRLFTVGRLDRDTTGAILVTNNGVLANMLMHPSSEVERVYLVATKIDIPIAKINTLVKGLKIDKRTIAHGKLQRLGKNRGLIHWRVILCEGKHHEIKRIFKALGSYVIHLHRESFAGITIDSLKPGKYRELKHNEVTYLQGVKKLQDNQ